MKRLVVDVAAPSAPHRPCIEPPSTSTVPPVRLNPLTKLFATVVCSAAPAHNRAGGAPTTPTVPELTRTLLEMTASFHLLRVLDDDVALRERLQARVHTSSRLEPRHRTSSTVATSEPRGRDDAEPHERGR